MKQASTSESIEDLSCNCEDLPLEKQLTPKSVTVVRESFYVDKPNNPDRLLLQYRRRNPWPMIQGLAFALLLLVVTGDIRGVLFLGMLFSPCFPFVLWLMLCETPHLTVLVQAGRIRVGSYPEQRPSVNTRGCIEVKVHHFNYSGCCSSSGPAAILLEYENGTSTLLNCGECDVEEDILKFFVSQLNDFLQLATSCSSSV